MSDPTPPLPIGAYVAAALSAANIPCDSGEDVDRFLGELARRGYTVATIDAARAAPSLDVAALAMATAAVVGSLARDYHREWAAKVAAEYARIKEQP